MANVNDKIFDRLVEHMSDVRLYEEGQQILQRRIIRRHQQKLKELLAKDIRGDVVPEVNRFAKELNSSTTNSIKEFSTSQIDFHTDNLYREVKDFYKMKKPSTKELLSEITGPGMKGEKSLSGNIKNIASGELVRIQSRVKAGLANNKPPKEIIAEVMRTTKLTENQAATLTRTAITSTQTAALNKVVQENKDVIKGYMFTAILDSRTSPICSHHNGKIYDADDKRFMPPLHWNCRSSLVPVLKSKKELAETESPLIKKRNLDKVKDEELDGKSPKIESFSNWLKRQPLETQSKMLGSDDAANLFREGKLKADQFVTPKGKVLSIQALRARASSITSVYRPRQAVKDVDLRVDVRNPNSLLNNPKHQADLENLFISDADDWNASFALTDFKGTSLVGKQESRRRIGNEFDERNFITDTFTGEVRSNLTYEPDYNLFQERLDFMKSAKDLTKEQKDFIEGFALRLSDKVSVNQQTVAVENLRVNFQRYNNTKEPWTDFSSVVRAENRFAVQNVSRLLDVRSRKRAELFGGFVSTGDKPKMQIMGKYYDVEDLVNDQLSNQRFIDNWRATEGTRLAKKVYFGGRAPINAYTQAIINRYPDKQKIIDKMLDNVVPFRREYKAYLKWKNKPPSDDWITKQIAKFREGTRQIYDLEWLYAKQRPTSKIMDDKVLHTTTKALKLVASGRATDYDALAINIGKMYHQDLGDLNPFATYTLQDYHKEGSKILEFMREQNLIRVSFRGKGRRGVWDVDTGRSSGGWAETITREVQVIDKTLLKLQEAELKATYARRFGVVSDRDRLYVKAGNKEFFDARGNKTGIPIISADKYPDYDPKQIDGEMAKMMNHVTSVKYEVDPEFFDFMDDVVRFRDPRGNTKYYDELNEFRHEIINRGEQGYGLMATAKYHRQRGKAFTTDVFIDSRGRVYHRGYLTPTGGEMVRPFLNSSKSLAVNSDAVKELRIQLGAMIGPGTEALTQSGRLEIFRRNEAQILELAGLLQSKTQRDRRIREFLEHPLIKGHEGAEVPKMARFALEYKRIHDHVGGDFSNTKLLSTYKTKLMIENDASSSGAQIISLSTGDRSIAEASNVVATTRKNRLYDLVAQDTVNDPEFLKIPALRNAGLTWEDLAKGAKAQNMVTFYGAGEATKTANIANKLSGILEKKGYTTITKDNVRDILRIVDGKIKTADKLGATATVDSLKSFRSELIEMVNGNTPVGRNLLTMARELHPDVEDFVLKVSNARVGLVGPKDFEEISRIMSKHLSQRAPVTDEFINFWKAAAKVYVKETEKVDIPWVTFDGKVMMQRYRGKNQTRIDFTDPVTGRKIANIYEGTVDDGKLRGKHAFQDAAIGLGVNGNHSNDAVIVRRFHLWGRDSGVDTGTIHDAFFTNLADAQKAKDALRTIYADALEGDTIRKTLDAWRKEGLPKSAYDALIADAKKRGLIDPPNKLTRADILAPIKDGYDWYGIGP